MACIYHGYQSRLDAANRRDDCRETTTSVPTLPTLAQEYFDELKLNIPGRFTVAVITSMFFDEHTRLFNGNVLNTSKAVVLPLDAQMSRIIIFCKKHGLFPSVKAGGYGTGGWAINGDIVIDLSQIQDIDIEPPQLGGGYTSLRDTASSMSKGKAPVGEPHEDTAEQAAGNDPVPIAWFYSKASTAIASFLHGPPLPLDESGEQPRRMLFHPSLTIDGPGSSTLPSAALITTTTTSERESGSGTLTSGGSSSRSPWSAFATNSAGSSHSPISDCGPWNVAPTPVSSRVTAWGEDVALSSHPLLAGEGDVPPHLTRPVPPHTHAYVSFGAGVKQKEVDSFTAANPLGDSNVPYHVPFSAHPVGASVMLLGGFGFLSRLHGLSIDSLVEAEVVLADGRITIVSEKEYPGESYFRDLWWGLRGSGTALCIATRYKARAYPVPVVFAGNLIYRFHRATAPSLLRHFRDCVKGAPRELYANVLLTAGPADQDSLVVIQMCYVGPKEQGLEYLQALSSWTGERCLLNEVHEKTFLSQQDSVAQVLRGKRGNQWFIRSALISSLPDEVINKTVLEFADTPVGCTWLFELAGGAIIDYEETCVAKAQREAAFTIAALHQWEMGIDDPRCVTSAEEWLRETIKPVASGGAFPSFLGRHEVPARVAASFGENWERLVALKKQYDPTGLFRNTFWPLDKDGAEIDPSEHEPPEVVFP
ncbi:hypothetical protein BGW80DRAFT_1549469 [Lactifluus volemus]|nr:hypothetical protein BGW80DRAFT_1549469 [Lactifluus volemus]